MALSLRKQRDGTFRPYWYGEYKDNGRRKVVNLNVRWKGTPPASGCLRDSWDNEFERSRDKAEVALKEIRDETGRKGRAEHLTERLIESKTGAKVEYNRINELPARWRGLARETEPTERRHLSNDAFFGRFVRFMANRKPDAVFLYEVTPEDTAAFMEHCRSELAPVTARECINSLNRAFTRFLPLGSRNPFADSIKRRGAGTGGTIHRKPFSIEELQKLLSAARSDKFLYPVVTTAACTGMRRGDACNLQWTAVDLPGGMIRAKTSKTGEIVEIPIFPLLREVLEQTPKKRRKGFVFPSVRVARQPIRGRR